MSDRSLQSLGFGSDIGNSESGAKLSINTGSKEKHLAWLIPKKFTVGQEYQK